MMCGTRGEAIDLGFERKSGSEDESEILIASGMNGQRLCSFSAAGSS